MHDSYIVPRTAKQIENNVKPHVRASAHKKPLYKGASRTACITQQPLSITKP